MNPTWRQSRFSTSNNLIGMPRHGTQNISSHISQYKHLVLSLVLQQPQCDFTLDTASILCSAVIASATDMYTDSTVSSHYQYNLV